jgi:hypothetical protein
MRERPRALHLLLLLPLAALGGWIWQRGTRTAPDRGAVLAALRAARGPILPNAAAAGSVSRAEIARYDRDSLYEAIDGAADGYLERGFVSAVMTTYVYALPEGAGAPGAGSPASPARQAPEIAAELHRFETEAGAKAQRDAEKPTAAAPVADMRETVSDGTVLLSVRGRDYLKLTSLSPGTEAAARLESLCRATFQEKTP